MDPQPDWPKPKYRPGQTVSYETHKGKTHVGVIRYVFREAEGRLDFYRVIRTKNEARETTFECSIKQRIE